VKGNERGKSFLCAERLDVLRSKNKKAEERGNQNN
jgi:hypothetical protein